MIECSADRARRHLWALPLAILGAAITLTIIVPPTPRLVWNASASAPIGLYAVSPGAPVETGEMVIAHMPGRYRMLAAIRHYLPANVPLVKRVRAISGDKVCAAGAVIAVNGHVVARRHAADARGRAMPWWQGCTTLRTDRVFLLMDHPDSFDGRYFGPSRMRDVVGKATLLWPR